MRKLDEQQELLLAFVDEGTAAKIDALGVRKDSKLNMKLVYGYMVSVSKTFDIDTLLKASKPFGKEWFRYRLVSDGSVFSFGYDTLSRETCIKSYDTLSRIIKLLDTHGIVNCNFGKPVDWFDEKCISISSSISNSNGINNKVINCIGDCDSDVLPDDGVGIREELEGMKAMVKGLAERVERLEAVVAPGQENSEHPEQHNTKSNNNGSFWDSWNRFIERLATEGDEDAERHYNTYISKVKQLYKDPSRSVESMQRQYSRALNQHSPQARKNTSGFTAKDEFKVDFPIEEYGYWTAFIAGLSQIQQYLMMDIPKEQRDAARLYYFNLLKKEFAGDIKEETIIKYWNEQIPKYPIGDES